MKTLLYIVLLLSSLTTFLSAEASKIYPIEGVHKKLNLSCKECHTEQNEKEYSSAMFSSCLKCHDNYEKLTERTGHLGHNNNVHKSPHFEDLECDTCHKSHQPSQNLCVQCHGQKTMKQLIVK